MLVINESEVENLLDWESTVEAVKIALSHEYLKKTKQSARTITGTTHNDTLLFTMPGYLEHATYGALACKLVTLANNQHSSRPIPNVMANIALFDEHSGELKAIVAGTAITTWRTAAASVIATKYLMQKHLKDKPLKLAIIGSGVQGRIHLKAFTHFFPFNSISVWNHNAENALKLVEELKSTVTDDTSIENCIDIIEAVKNADVIITATSSTEPILKLDWIKNGAHINAVGVQNNCVSELDMDIYKTGDIYIDHWAGAQNELSNLSNNGVKFVGEIGALIAGSLKPRPQPRVTVFQSLGMAVEDCAMVRMVYDKYQFQNQQSK